ncbi:uncharacterized protein LOC133180093 [Saccostrea echinata]|uniref:uncharacterized protein LOC133180093 n=1 Tax=Saccostrea echinata TaxID=191078 RepID=UPI002A831F67|nr:uncharacterized protein LOC133180093 [Saccostrea echinata]
MDQKLLLLCILCCMLFSEENSQGSVYGKTSSTTEAPDEMCDCDCEYMDKIESFNNASNPYINKTQEQLLVMLEKELNQMKTLLQVQKKEIPAVKARKISATDVRPSAKNVGMIGVAFMAFVFGGIVVLDLISLPQYLRNLKRNLC